MLDVLGQNPSPMLTEMREVGLIVRRAASNDDVDPGTPQSSLIVLLLPNYWITFRILLIDSLEFKIVSSGPFRATSVEHAR